MPGQKIRINTIIIIHSLPPQPNPPKIPQPLLQSHILFTSHDMKTNTYYANQNKIVTIIQRTVLPFSFNSINCDSYN